MNSEAPSNTALIPRAVQDTLAGAATTAVINTAGKIFSDYASLEKHRGENQRYRNESGAAARQNALVNINCVTNTPMKESNGSTAKGVVIGVTACAGVVAAVGGAYYIGKKHQEEKERQVRIEAQRLVEEQRRHAFLVEDFFPDSQPNHEHHCNCCQANRVERVDSDDEN